MKFLNHICTLIFTTTFVLSLATEAKAEMHQADALTAIQHGLTLFENIQAEHREVVYGHQERYVPEILVHTNQHGEPQRTPYVMITIHGLYNQVQTMHPLAEYFYQQGFNVINMRLPGHFEQDPHNLDKVQWQDWQNELNRMIALAPYFGDKIILAGHSAGASLAVNAVVNLRQNIEGLVLFSPGYKFTFENSLKSSGLSFFGVSDFINKPKYPVERYLSTYAADQLAEMNQTIFGSNYKSQLPKVQTRLKAMPIFQVDTAIEQTVQLDFNQQIYALIKDNSANQYLLIDAKYNVLHKDIVSDAADVNPAFSMILGSLTEFLNKNYTGR